MASAAHSLRLCLRTLRRPAPISRSIISRPYLLNRPISSTPQWHKKKRDAEEEDVEHDVRDVGVDEELTPEIERAAQEALRDPTIPGTTKLVDHVLHSVDNMVNAAARGHRVNRATSFWNDDEDDPDMITDELNEDEFEEDDITAIAHGKLEEYRDQREYARIAAWQMPLLSKLARPFEPPTTEEPLRFRYTTYMGEFHPAENKVVVEFSPRDMPLTEAQQLKLKKLLGPRYNPEKDLAKMSCEQFEHQAQNKRYLGDVVNKLVEQAQDSSDMFEDIPLDLRHHPVTVKPKFPKEWRLTEERMKFIQDTRQASLLLDQTKEQEGTLISGPEKIQQAFATPDYELNLKVPAYEKAAKPKLQAARPTASRPRPLRR
ncbi:hypothetical protein F4780DRAFT_776056 [Xylariomycetidae sp. FL0641]|nr:hypothetical protein F4780DRAFT_776056 [Xylariomycetidae sp. FL0641]